MPWGPVFRGHSIGRLRASALVGKEAWNASFETNTVNLFQAGYFGACLKEAICFFPGLYSFQKQCDEVFFIGVASSTAFRWYAMICWIPSRIKERVITKSLYNTVGKHTQKPTVKTLWAECCSITAWTERRKLWKTGRQRRDLWKRKHFELQRTTQQPAEKVLPCLDWEE